MSDASTAPENGDAQPDPAADSSNEFDRRDGRYADPITHQLATVSGAFEDVQKLRKTQAMRVSTQIFGGGEKTAEQMAAVKVHPWVEPMLELEQFYSKELQKLLKQHPLYPWLKPLKGLAGPRTGRIIGAIGDPMRFPGQRCTMGHTFRPGLEVGSPCPLADFRHESDGQIGQEGGAECETESDRRAGAAPQDVHAPAEGVPESDIAHGPVACPGVMLGPREGSGCASVWHYFGVIPGRDGRLIKLRKGEQASFDPGARVLLLGPQGPGEQIVKQRTPKYREIYDGFKARRAPGENFPPIRIEHIARLVATKAFLGDMLQEWKRLEHTQ